jgi:hypothetical protein
VAFLDLITGFGSVEEVSGSVRLEGAENTAFRDAIPEESHALGGILLIDEHHFVNPVGGIV